jgi:16S rRNA (cytidine1402-2'-O)-methyltransferase
VFYEAPHRIERTLGDLAAHFGDRKAALARELTKKFEEIRRGTLPELLESVRSTPPKGEMVIILAGCARKELGQGSSGSESEDPNHGEELDDTGATA